MNPLSWNPWLVLLIAGLFEIGWPLGLKMGAANAAMRYVGPAIAVACMAASGFFLWLSLGPSSFRVETNGDNRWWS